MKPIKFILALFLVITVLATGAYADNMIQNPGFEAYNSETLIPDEWNGDGNITVQINFPGTPDGFVSLGTCAPNLVDTYYQVIDLSSIPDWDADPEYHFINFDLSAYFCNMGGQKVAIGLEILPYSYNTTDSVAWNDPAWETRAWRVKDDGAGGLEFVNDGGDAIDLSILLERDPHNGNPVWEEKLHNGWLPKVRWVRVRLEYDSSSEGSLPDNCVGIDLVSFDASCREFGPYSGFGDLPEASFWEDPNAPDKGVPGWVGPEGDGICGGYTGQTLRNYVNPAFAGFADNYANYSSSGQYIYGGYGDHPENISGRPFTDAGWTGMIITLGDMDLDMLADYFSDTPSGSFHPGEITAVFEETPIINGEGHDFACFENGFVSGWTTSEIFGENAFVEVSSNGTDFIRMPTHSLTPKWPGGYGCYISQGVFGIVGKHVNAYGDSWGTPFDLEWIADYPQVLDGTVDLYNIRYVKMVDIPGGGPLDANGGKTALFYDSYGLPIFDSWVTWGSGGVDLDAVAVLNSSALDTDEDHITDYWDNCSETENQKQYDTDEDGYGNMCDCDIDGEEGGDGAVSMADYFVFMQAFGSNGPIRIPGEPGQPDEYIDPSENWNADADFDGDNYVTMADYFIFTERFGSSAPFN